ncbi:threonine/serine exporter family protein [Paenibacillus terrae]|uniref:Membrane protein n=1 Tax=Paenibacillus terrae TaxID=159743 RepID=A0A0D7XA64_9BACL|nr:threonine/serine exporter family protein [Paenibacillus terrae]KJD47052.1 membrane protein [Paenibacillus terrae]
MLAQLFTSFIATAAFGILFHAPRHSLLQCGFVGMLGWLVYYWTTDSMGPVSANLLATVLIGIISQSLARLYKMPVIIFSVAGMIPLVPGGMAYNAMRQFVQHNYPQALELAMSTLMIAGAIAVGLVLSEVLNQIFRNIRFKPQR